ncbi:MAG: Chitinase [Hydrocarboniphaga sp.]|uniref:M36 family metallopeptidase n=1 Tax=Hydrocarboniphaga sp. TaxID=2033016 RepID=UPI002623D7E4|nr:M36 family metallopeptidase [Hydrocarboniphaga sp.]MDB5969084.1 Chitinase [Hydrocarboniphaga sp.]
MKARVFVLSLSLAASSTYAAQPSAPRYEASPQRPNFDSYRASLATDSLASPPVSAKRASLQSRVAAQRNAQGYASSFDVQTGSAPFLWAAPALPRATVGALNRRALPEALGRAYLSTQAGLLGLDRQAIEDARVTDAGQNRQGTMIARFQQRVDGIDVFTRSLNLLMDSSGRLIATSGGFHKPRGVTGSFALSQSAAISKAIADLGGHLPAGALSSFKTLDDYSWFASATNSSDYVLSRAVRAKRVYYPAADGLQPAYYIEVMGAPAGSHRRDAYGYVISAADGSLLFRKDLTAYESFTYRVFADTDGINQPYDQPLGNGYAPYPGTGPADLIARSGVASSLVTLDHSPAISTGDPWLSADATTTTGNNVDAFLDSGLLLGVDATSLVTDGYQAGTGDLRTTLTSANTFDWPIAADDDPSTDNAKNAAIVNLFYMNNWLHDWWYDHGFNEAAGNAQTSNYGRNGSEGDAISAQGQDASGRDNANMSTPADGGSPTMQMYLFDGSIHGEVKVTAPTAGEPLVFTQASFGPTEFDVSNIAALASESDGDSTSDGCSALPAVPVVGTTLPATPDLNLSGKIALIDRGTCAFTTKEQFATLSGAVAMIVINNVDGSPIVMGNADLPTLPINIPLPTTDTLYTLPAVMIGKADGDALKARIAAGETLTMHVQRLHSIDYDGTLDEQIIAHEFFHHVSNRLVGDGSGLSNTQGGGMGEGWSDFDALLLTIRPEDALVAGNEHYQGIYPLAYYAVPGIVPVAPFYYGIRRMPYSKQFQYNSLTFKHVQDGEPLADTAPVAYGQDGASNSEVHNTGEVWAQMLFECYTNILDNGEHSFEQSRSNMMDYVIAGLKMTPSQPTITQARDGVLAAALAADFGDYNACARGFAKRGAGIGAIAPASTSTDNTGVTESYVALIASTPTLAPGIGGDVLDFTLDSCDQDGVLDAGESGILSFELINNGGYEPGQTLSGTLSTSSAGVTLANGGKLGFAVGAVGTTSKATVKATLASSVSGPQTIALTLKLDPPASPDPAVQYPEPSSYALIANADIARTSATDGFEYAALSSPDWAVASTGTSEVWAITDQNAITGSGNAWFAPDEASAATLDLTSPLFTVPAGGRFAFSFDHEYDFDADLLVKYDGGAIDVSVDGGAWQDAAAAGASFARGYDGNISALGRSGYGGSSGGVVHETLDFGSTLSGHTVKLRFVLGSDASVGGAGWIIDNVVATDAGTPFNQISSDNGICANRAPVAMAGDDFSAPERSGSGLSLSTITLAGQAADPEGAAGFTVKWTQTAGPMVTLTNASTLTASFVSPSVSADTALRFRLTATDGGGLSASDEVQVTIVNVNRPPIANAGADGSGSTGLASALNGSASSDPDGDALSYVWSQVSGPSVTLSGAGGAYPSFTPNGDGSYVFQLTVTDPANASSSDEVTVQAGGGSSGGSSKHHGGGAPNLALLALLAAAGGLRQRLRRSAIPCRPETPIAHRASH